MDRLGEWPSEGAIEVGQRWCAVGVATDWIEISGRLGPGVWAVISALGEIGTITTEVLLHGYELA